MNNVDNPTIEPSPSLTEVKLSYKSKKPTDTFPQVTSPDESEQVLRNVCDNDHIQLKDDDTYNTILNEFIKLWDESDSRVREDLMKTVIQSLISHVDNDNTGDIEINFLADKKLEAEWAEIKKCEPEKVQVRTTVMRGSPGRIRTYDRSVNSRLLCH